MFIHTFCLYMGGMERYIDLKLANNRSTGDFVITFCVQVTSQ